MDGLQGFEDKGLITYPVNSIANRSGLEISKNKRNGLKQKQHLYLARRRKEDMKAIDLPMKAPEGRPTQEQTVREWQELHPGGRKVECIQETGLSKPTVYKWWRTAEHETDSAEMRQGVASHENSKTDR